MSQKKIKIGNLLFPKKTLLKILGVLIFIALLDNFFLRFFHTSSLLIIIPINLILLLIFLRSIKGEITEIKP